VRNIRWAKFPLIAIALAFAALPAAFVATLLLYPFWSWLEATYGIESVGHSGPADWCFETVYGVLIVVSLAWLLRAWRRRAH
jgi:hypothetical protein